MSGFVSSYLRRYHSSCCLFPWNHLDPGGLAESVLIPLGLAAILEADPGLPGSDATLGGVVAFFFSNASRELEKDHCAILILRLSKKMSTGFIFKLIMELFENFNRQKYQT
jgi:hypothetical protein